MPFRQPLHVIPVAEGRLIIKCGIEEILVSGAGVETVAGPLLDRLDRGRSLEEAVEDLPGDQQQAGRRLAEALESRHWVHDGNGDDDHEAAEDPQQEAFYANFGAAGRQAARRLTESRVEVHGGGQVAGQLAARLRALGVGSVSAFDGETDGGARHGSGCDLVVAASDLGQEEALLAAGQRALADGVPFLPAWIADMVGFLGPLTYPYETACLRCYQLRVDANIASPVAHRAKRRAASQDSAVGGAAGLLPPMAGVVADIGAVEVAKALGGWAPSDVAGRSIEINLVAFRSSVRRVLKLPRCPDCGEGSRHARRVILNGPQIHE